MFARLVDRAFLAGLSAAGGILRPKGVPVLHYHSVDGENMASVTRAAFAGQMRFLKEQGFSAVSMGDVVRYIEGEGALAQKSLAITFDDGYRTNYEIAFPALCESGFKAIVFVATGRVGLASDWSGKEGACGLPLLSWPEIREMSDHGVEFGAHTETHPRLTRIPRDAAFKEMVGSKKRLEDMLGRPCRHFAYPYGDYDEDVKTLAREAGFTSACTTEPGLSLAGDDLFSIKRSGVFRNTDVTGLKARLNGSFRWYHYAKRRVRMNAGSVRS